MLEKNYFKKIMSSVKTFSYERLLDLLKKGIYTFWRFEIKVHSIDGYGIVQSKKGKKIINAWCLTNFYQIVIMICGLKIGTSSGRHSVYTL